MGKLFANSLSNMQGTTPTVAETGRSSITQSSGMNIMSTLKASFPLLALAMETVVDQIQQHLKPNSDGDIYRLIVALLNDDVKDIIRSPKYLGAECIYMMLRELKSESKNWLSSVRNLMINCNKNDSYTKTIESMQVAIEYLKENQIPRHKAKIDDLTKTTFHAIHEILEER
ncbi:13417_t:CDS:2, partial [Entrophospora sp. SA101]